MSAAPGAGLISAGSGDPQPALDQVFGERSRAAIDRGHTAGLLAA